MNRYSFTGKGNILLRAATSGKYGSKNYEQGEPIAYFTDVNLGLDFSVIEKVPKAGTSNLLGSSDYKPSALFVSSIKTSDSLLSLVYKKQENETKQKTIIKNLDSIDGILYLPVSLDEEILNDIFIYSVNSKERMSTFTLNNTDQSILGLPDGKYTIFYKIRKVAKNTFALVSNNMPNMSAELQILGNINGKTGEAIIHLNKIKLMVSPSMDFNSSEPFTDTLEFGILDDSGSIVEVNYYG